MKRILLFLVPLFLLASACRKEKYPPELVTDPEVAFYSSFKANGVPVKLEAGRNGYYMYSALKRDTNGVYNFVGELKQLNSASNSPNSLKIQINDSKVSPVNVAPVMDSALQLKTYPYFNYSNGNGYAATFFSSYTGNVANYSWDFGDSSKSNEATPYHVFLNAGTYKVSLAITGIGGCVSSISNTLKVGPNNPLNAYVSTNTGSGNSLSFASNIMGGKAPYTYVWELGDGANNLSLNPTHNYNVPGGYQVRLKVVDANSATSYVNYNAATNNNPSSCAANFYFSSISPLPINLGLSNVIVNWTDASGTTYSSINNSQQNNSSFEIVSVENYGVNENNEPVKKVKVKFTCKVYNGTQSVQLDNAEVVTCVAYK